MRVQYLEDAEPYKKGDVIEIDDDRADAILENGTAKEVDRKTPLANASITVDQEVAKKESVSAERAALQKQANSLGREVTGTVDGEEVTVKPAKEKPAAAAKKTTAKK